MVPLESAPLRGLERGVGDALGRGVTVGMGRGVGAGGGAIIGAGGGPVVVSRRGRTGGGVTPPGVLFSNVFCAKTAIGQDCMKSAAMSSQILKVFMAQELRGGGQNVNDVTACETSSEKKDEG